MSQQVETELGVISLISGGHLVSHLFLLAFPPLFPLLAREFHVSVTSFGMSISLIYLAQFLLQIPPASFVDDVAEDFVVRVLEHEMSFIDEFLDRLRHRPMVLRNVFGIENVIDEFLFD